MDGRISGQNLNDSLEIADGFKCYHSAQKSVENETQNVVSMEVSQLTTPVDSKTSGKNCQSSATQLESEANVIESETSLKQSGQNDTQTTKTSVKEYK